MARCVDCLHHEPCAAFDLVRTKLWGDNADKMCRMFKKAVPDISVGDKPSCKVCERIAEANKDIFWTFARTHQPGTQEEFLRIPYEETRFCPVCGCDLKDRATEKQERRIL